MIRIIGQRASGPLREKKETRFRAAQEKLAAILRLEEILDRPLDRIARAADAGFYRLIPLAVMRPRNVDDARALFQFSRQERFPLTFRSAGMSLSDQAVTDGLLLGRPCR